jgi:TonB family protein
MEMEAAAQRLRSYDTTLNSYRECLDGEVSQKSLGRTAEEAQAIRADADRKYAGLRNGLTLLQACFSTEKQRFDTTGGGQKAVPVDCNTRYAIVDVAERPIAVDSGAGDSPFSEPNVLASGTWRYRVAVLYQHQLCRKGGKPECARKGVEIDNSSGSTLECDATLELDGVDVDGQSHLQRRGVVPPHRRGPVLQVSLPPATTVKSVTAQCVARAPLPRLDTPAQCQAQIVKTINLEDYYPATSRRILEEGPVALQYTLTNSEGSPTDIRVVGSSLSDRLDAAAVKALSDMGMKTNCPGQPLRLRLMFKLLD